MSSNMDERDLPIDLSVLIECVNLGKTAALNLVHDDVNSSTLGSSKGEIDPLLVPFALPPKGNNVDKSKQDNDKKSKSAQRGKDVSKAKTSHRQEKTISSDNSNSPEEANTDTKSPNSNGEENGNEFSVTKPSERPCKSPQNGATSERTLVLNHCPFMNQTRSASFASKFKSKKNQSLLSETINNDDSTSNNTFSKRKRRRLADGGDTSYFDDTNCVSSSQEETSDEKDGGKLETAQESRVLQKSDEYSCTELNGTLKPDDTANVETGTLSDRSQSFATKFITVKNTKTDSSLLDDDTVPDVPKKKRKRTLLHEPESSFLGEATNDVAAVSLETDSTSAEVPQVTAADDNADNVEYNSVIAGSLLEDVNITDDSTVGSCSSSSADNSFNDGSLDNSVASSFDTSTIAEVSANDESAQSTLSVNFSQTGQTQQQEATDERSKLESPTGNSCTSVENTSKEVVAATPPQTRRRSTRKVIRKAPQVKERKTPMGLPKPLRLNKPQFSVEEIYTNKNFRTPTLKSLETIFEDPKEDKDGKLRFLEKKRKKRAIFFETNPNQRPVHKKAKLAAKAKRASKRKKKPSDDATSDELLIGALAQLDDNLAMHGLVP